MDVVLTAETKYFGRLGFDPQQERRTSSSSPLSAREFRSPRQVTELQSCRQTTRVHTSSWRSAALDEFVTRKLQELAREFRHIRSARRSAISVHLQGVALTCQFTS